jgi:hypothetical protein
VLFVQTWFSEAFLQENINPLAYLYDVQDAFAFTGYEAGRTAMDIGCVSASIASKEVN